MGYRYVDQDPITQDALTELGAVFMELRRSRGLSQRMLAQRSGLSQGTISKLENGNAPWLTTIWLARLLAGLDVRPGEFGFTPRPIEDPTPGWLYLMRRFDNERRRKAVATFEERRLAAVEAAINERARRRGGPVGFPDPHEPYE